MVVNSVVDMSSECAAQSAIQYFENMRNFLVAVGKMQLLTCEASDLEKVRLISFFTLARIICKYVSHFFTKVHCIEQRF